MRANDVSSVKVTGFTRGSDGNVTADIVISVRNGATAVTLVGLQANLKNASQSIRAFSVPATYDPNVEGKLCIFFSKQKHRNPYDSNQMILTFIPTLLSECLNTCGNSA